MVKILVRVKHVVLVLMDIETVVEVLLQELVSLAGAEVVGQGITALLTVAKVERYASQISASAWATETGVAASVKLHTAQNALRTEMNIARAATRVASIPLPAITATKMK